MLYGAAVWDPVLIIAQIISIQCLFYLSLGLWQVLFLGPYVGRLSVAQIFGWRAMSFKSYVGSMTMLSNVANSALGALYLVWIVERAKKCLDFASTCYIIHFSLCWWYAGFPASLEWWAVNGAGLLVMSLLGEWLCVRRELADIPLGQLRSRRAASAAPIGASMSAGGVQMGTLSGGSSGVGVSGVGGGLARSNSTSRLLDHIDGRGQEV